MNKYSKVCIVNSLYSLLIYLLIINEEEYQRTFFFFVPPFPKVTSMNFENGTYVNWPKKSWKKIFYLLYYRLVAKYRYKFVKNADFWGKDNLQLTSALIGDKPINVLEDGVLNYTLQKERRWKFVKRMFGGPLMGEKAFGYSSFANKVYLTGLAPVPKEIKDKVVLIDIFEKWNNSTETYKKEILSLYGLSKTDIEDYKSVDTILFTQPLYEDGTLEEKEKIDIYKNITKGKNIAIKPHPKETTDYKRFFPEAKIMKASVPIELLTLAGVKFRDVYTLFSTAAFAFNYPLNVHFIGTKVHPKVLKRFGDLIMEDGVVKRLDESSTAPKV